MRKLGRYLLLGALGIVAGCSSGGNVPGSPGAPSILAITTTSLPAGKVGAAYSSPVAASGGTTPYTYSASGLPSGLSISSSTGAITGTPGQNSAGTASATIKVTDSSQPSSQSVTAKLSIKISPASLTVTTTSLPAGAATLPYPTTTLRASGGVPPYKWALASGSSLPAGLSLSAGGVISGTPAAGSSGSYSLTFVVTDSFTTPETARASLVLTISGGLTLTTTRLADATVNKAYSAALAAVGGVAPYRFSLASGSGLPAGLTLSSAGVISGTPTKAGTTTFSIDVTDSSTPTPLTQTGRLSITVNASAGGLTLTTTTLAEATVNTAYSATLTATGGVAPYTFSLASGSGLPAGLTLASAGVISGTPTKAGATAFSVDVMDSSTPTPLSQTGNLSITVNATAGPSCGNMSTGNGASLNGYVPFPSTNAWNTNIASASIDPNSAAIIAALTGSHLHPDFSNVVDGNYGIPYVVVDSSVTPGVPVTMNTYASESDITLYPVPLTAPIEGFPPTCTTTGDNHLIVIDKRKCWIYESWQAQLCSGAWSAANGAIWDLTSTEHRPYGWTSADAAGLPIFPGLVRYDEVAAGAIKHAIRITVAHTKSDANGGYFVAPATHAAGNNSSTDNIMGMRLRLKASFNISSFSAANQVILTAMKDYGMIVADNGSNMYFQGTPDARWDDDDLGALKGIDASEFDVVQMGAKYDAATAPTGAAPTISSFAASETTVTAGTPVTLSWVVSNDSYDYIDVVGPVRGGSQTVTPSATTIYTLNSTNQYGRSTMAVTVNVQ